MSKNSNKFIGLRNTSIVIHINRLKAPYDKSTLVKITHEGCQVAFVFESSLTKIEMMKAALEMVSTRSENSDSRR